MKPTRFSKNMQRHLEKKGWCPCKQHGWDMAKAIEGQKDGRSDNSEPSAPVNHVQINQTVQGNNNVNTVNNTTVNIHLHTGVLPSGSEAERMYLQQHAATIYKSILAGTTGPEPDILSRFVRETWCSRDHEQLHNVVALTKKQHKYILLQMRDGEPQIETIVGPDAPERLVNIANAVMQQFAKDSFQGHDPSWHQPPIFDALHNTREGAEEERRKHGQGVVCQWKHLQHIYPSEREEWINNRAPNAPPMDRPVNADQVERTATTARSINRNKKSRKQVGGAVSCQLQEDKAKSDKRAKLEFTAHARRITTS